MRLPLATILTLIIIQLIIDSYIYVVLRKRCKGHRRWDRIQLYSAIALLIYLAIALIMPRRGGSDAALQTIMWMLFGYLTVYMPKLLFTVTDLIAQLPRLWHSRRMQWLSTAGCLMAVTLSVAMWWGALINRYNINVNEVTLEVPNLPESFNGFRVIQFSDFHVGTYGTDTGFAQKLVSRINSLDADAVLFTGDIVNRRTEELRPFVNTLSGINARHGVYSILGNHDYGDYYSWPSADAKRQNMELMYELQRDMGWKLLLNETAWIKHGTDSIAVIGVENWGDPPFPCYGNLKQAYPSLADSNTKILLTHNPYHWEQEIADNDTANIALTLSGHTHAMQVSVGHISPAAIRYDEWGGLYRDSSSAHPLYVNIGIGTVGIPMRLGATPEITILTLKPLPH